MPTISPQAAAPPIVLAIDLGTSSARAILFDGRGRKIQGADSQIHYRMDTTDDGGVEIDADRLVEIVALAVDGLLTKTEGLRIEAVAVSTFWHSLMGVDDRNKAVTPLYSWNDTRASVAAQKLKLDIDESSLHARTGCVLHASYWPAKITWLRESDGELFGRISRWISIGEYFYLCLFGQAVSSISMASATGLFNQNRCDWDEETLLHLAVSRDQLSPVGDMDVRFDNLTSEYGNRWPALKGAEWFLALGDGACNNIGAGSVTADRAALMIGTSGALRVLWKAEAVKIPAGLWCYRADRRRFVMGGALSNGGDVYAWMKNTLNLKSSELVEAEIAAMKPDAHGLTLLPFLSGERSTGWRDDARAAITGIGLDTSPIELLRAGLESVAYRFAAIYDLLVKEVGEPREIIGSGAALLRSPAWAQIISDVIGKQIIASDEVETSSRGAALEVLEALGAISDIEELETAPGRLYSPNPEHHAQYLKARARQQRLYEAIIEQHPMFGLKTRI